MLIQIRNGNLVETEPPHPPFWQVQVLWDKVSRHGDIGGHVGGTVLELSVGEAGGRLMEVKANEVGWPSQLTGVLNYGIPSCTGLRVGQEDNTLGGRGVLKDGGNVRSWGFGGPSRQPEGQRKLGPTSDTFVRKNKRII